ncbi:MAG TPA: 2,3-diphosphoglycerate synthetase [Egibacteraceae bacterium]|nr:2,3-diphosphoglycerate synthetase [Egibacteraceae bacterium]
MTQPSAGRRAIVLVDGEHYPEVVRAALAHLSASGTVPAAALFLGGTEKVDAHGVAVDVGAPIQWVPRRAGAVFDLDAAAAALRELITTLQPDVVVDLSDEPILDHRRRLQLASHALLAGVAYEGPDFRLVPPPMPALADVPSIAVVGTGKRTGKTAVAGELVRCLRSAGRKPVVVAMGRGGPAEPVVVPAGAALGIDALLAVADAGGHAASDFYEDAISTGAAAVGARRCGGGLAGAVGYSNVAEAVGIANGMGGDLLVLEGSGAALPPVRADATVLIVPGDCDPEFLSGYLGPYRVLLADLVVVTMCESPRSSPAQVEAVLGAIRSISRRTPVLCTVLRPAPLGAITGERVLFATTAPDAVASTLAAMLETDHGCDVVATSSHLADRPALRADLASAPAFDVLLVEVKAAAVDVAARVAADRGARVVFCDNRPIVIDVDPTDEQAEGDQVLTFKDAVERLAGLASERFAAR